MGNGINKVLPDLYLGNFKDSKDREQLAKNNITHILSIYDSASPLLQEMTYLCIPAADIPTQNLAQFFKQSIMFMHESRLKGEGCLVHWYVEYSKQNAIYSMSLKQVLTCAENSCRQLIRAISMSNLRQLQEFVIANLAGVSRSVTLVVAYIMTVTGLGWQDALAAVKVARPCASPNLGFQRQLQEFEDTKVKQFREWLQTEYKDNPFNDEAEIRELLAKIPAISGEGEKKDASMFSGET